MSIIPSLDPYMTAMRMFISTDPIFIPKRTKKKYWMKPAKKGYTRNGRKKHNRHNK
jgi:hypothetical protein